MSYNTSWQASQAQISAIPFVGRKDEQKKYEDLLTKDTPWVMTIAGLPGSGKTMLLRRLEDKTKTSNIPVVKIDFTQPWPRSDILIILEKLAEQITPHCDSNAQLSLNFMKKLEDSRNKLIEIGKNIDQIMIAKDKATIENVQMLIDTANIYKEKVLQVNAQMLSAFYNLIDSFRPDRLVIMFDASEWLNKLGNEEVGRWVMDQFISEFHDRMQQKQKHCSFVIASRDRPQPSVPKEDTYVQDLLPLNREEVDDYLRRLEIKNPNDRKEIYEITHGHPLCVSLIGALWQQGGIPSISELPEVRQELKAGELLQFLGNRILDQQLPLPFDEVTRYGALLRSFTLPMLLEVFPSFFKGNGQKQFAQLINSFYIVPKGNRHSFHDLLREILATYVRENEPVKWKNYHKKASDYLEKHTENLPSPRPNWSKYPLDWYYHKLACDEKKGLAAWSEAIAKASADGAWELWSELLLVVQDKTLALSPVTRAVITYEQGRYNSADQKWDEALNNYMQSLDLYRKVYDPPGQAKASTAIAEVYRFRPNRDLKQAITYYDQARSIYRQIGKPEHQAHQLRAMGDIYYLRSNLEAILKDAHLKAALKCYEEAQVIYGSLGDQFNQHQAYIYGSMGDAYRDLKEMDEAMRQYQKALNVYPAMKASDPLVQAHFYIAVAEIYQEKWQWNEARDSFREALNIYKESNNRHGKMAMNSALGYVEQQSGHPDAAREFYEKALEDSVGENNRWHQAFLHQALGDIDRVQFNLSAAQHHYQEALDKAEGDEKRIAYLYQRIADVRRSRHKDKETTLEDYDKAFKGYSKVGDNAGMAYVSQNIAEVEQSRQNLDVALKKYKDALEYYKEVRDNAGAAYTCKTMGEIEQSLQQWSNALDYFKQALSFYQSALKGGQEDKAGKAYILKSMGEVEQAINKLEAAKGHFTKAIDLYGNTVDLMGAAYVCKVRGDVQSTMKDWNNALTDYQRALRIYRLVEQFLAEKKDWWNADSQRALRFSQRSLSKTEIERWLSDNAEHENLPSQAEISQFIDEVKKAMIPVEKEVYSPNLGSY